MILLRPVDKRFPVTQVFGENPDWYPKTNGHNGIDYGLPEGNPIMAAADGVVIRADLDPVTAANSERGYGYHVRIKHADDSTTIYGHVIEGGLLVHVGQEVKMGDVIAKSGDTGFSTAPHLHFELRTGTSVLSGIDPAPFIVDEIPSQNAVLIASVTEAGDGVNIRRGPSTKFDSAGHLVAGGQVDVFGFAGTDAWLQVENGFLKFDPGWYDLDAVGAQDDALFKVTITVEGGILLREGPGTGHPQQGVQLPGTEFKVLALTGGNAWMRIQNGFVFYDPEWYEFSKLTLETEAGFWKKRWDRLRNFLTGEG